VTATVETPRSWYTDRNAARVFLGVPSSITVKDAQIDKFIARASKRIEKFTGRRFIPWTGVKEFDYQGTKELIFGDDLVSASSVAHGDGTDTIDPTDYFLYPLNAADDNKPYLTLQVLTTDDFIIYDDTRQSAIQITGKWGYCEITKNSTSLLSAAISSTTAITVGVDDGTDFSIGQVIKVDDEQMFITNISTNDLTVSRGLNGTTAATHVNDSIVYILKAPEDIQMACEILVARWLHRADASWADRIGTGDTSKTYKQGMPLEGFELLKPYRRMAGIV